MGQIKNIKLHIVTDIKMRGEDGEEPLSHLDPEIAEEVEAVTVIFEGQVTSNVDGDDVDVIFTDQDLSVTFTLTGEYPEVAAVERVPCPYFLRGRCKFGDKCFNIHNNENNRQKNGTVASAINGIVITDTNGGEDVVEQKRVMKTANDVINRISWDESFPQENFTVGYLDVGSKEVREKPFTKFAWEGVDGDVKQRVQYFKYLGVLVWSKGERLDRVFGSTGGDADILDIINGCAISKALHGANIG